MSNYQKLEISDAAKGFTDNYIGRSPDYFKKLFNMYVDVDKNPKSRPGSLSDGATDAAGSSGSNSGINLIANLVRGNKPYRVQTVGGTGGVFKYFSGSAWTELLGPTSGHLFSSAHSSASDTRICSTKWVDHLFLASMSFTQKPQMVYFDSGAGTHTLLTMGLPRPASTVDATTATYTSGTTNYYLVYAIWEYTYTVGNKTFIDHSEARSFQLGTTGSPPASFLIPTTAKITNTSLTNYATASTSLKLKLYRTIANGVEAYLVGSCTNASLASAQTITDAVSDAALALNEIMYFNSGLPQTSEPPICKFIHVTQRGTGYFGYVQDTNGDTISNRVRQSLQGNPKCSPGDFFADLDEEVTGLSSYRGIPLFFTRNFTYRAESEFLEDGTGGLFTKIIAEGIGTISHNSIVQTEYGVFFAGDNGFYWTDGYQVRTLSDEIKDTYSDTYTSDALKKAITGCYDIKNQWVVWSFKQTSTSHGMFVFHRRFGLKEDGTFTQWGGRAATPTLPANILLYPTALPSTTLDNFRVDSLAYIEGTLYRGDTRGYAFTFETTSLSDPRVVTAANISTWGTNHIYYDLETSALDFGTALIRKWSSAAAFTFRNLGSLAVSVQVDRDLKNVYKFAKEIKNISDTTWGEDGILWGDPELWDEPEALFIKTRRFPAPGFRCTYRNLRLTNSFTVVQKSDNLGLGTFSGSGTSRSVLLVNAATEIWPTDCLDYYIAFNIDGYYKHFLITARTDDTLTISDPSNLLPTSGDYSWVIKGFLKDSGLDVQSMTLPYLMLSDSITPFHTGDEGANA